MINRVLQANRLTVYAQMNAAASIRKHTQNMGHIRQQLMLQKL